MKPEYILEASPVVQIHLVGALAALTLGIVMGLRPKGTRSHKMIGRSFIVFMLVTAISSYWIRDLNRGNLSWIHIFIPLTLFASWQTIYYIRKGDVTRHKRAVTGMFFGALLIPGLFSFAPGRRLWLVFFG